MHLTSLGRVSTNNVVLLACLEPSAQSWTASAWRDLREAGYAAALIPFAPLPAARESGLTLFEGPANGPWCDPDSGRILLQLSPGFVHTAENPDAPWLLDTSFALRSYPVRHRQNLKPWGWFAGNPDPDDLIPLALAACAAGATLLAVPVGANAKPLAQAVKALAGVLGRELWRAPKPPEGHAFRNVSTEPSVHSETQLFASQSGAFKVGYQGARGAFSEMAVFTLFPPSRTEAVPFKTFREVFQAVEDGQIDFAMLPFENALAGPIQDNYDLLQEYSQLEILAETQVRVEHNLIGFAGTPLADIQRVFSHPQALAQSRRFLESHPNWEAVPFYDTAGSVAHVAQTNERSWAAIASSEAAKVWGMTILQAGVETNHQNFTRFFLLGPQGTAPVGKPTKASLLFSTPDHPGALSRCLAVFARHGLNMKKLESRPIHGRPWEYSFYVDVALPDNADEFEAAWEELTKVSLNLRLVGKYPGLKTVQD
ncbi:MAG: prephenate dehydratase [Spirochaetales bacterium]|nr:prephenate dehydratase [Spirochaetales bacterium]